MLTLDHYPIPTSSLTVNFTKVKPLFMRIMFYANVAFFAQSKVLYYRSHQKANVNDKNAILKCDTTLISCQRPTQSVYISDSD